MRSNLVIGKLVIGICLVIVIWLLVIPCYAAETKVIKIGCSAPFTGDQAKIGLDLLNGAKLAVIEANEKGEVIPGYTLEVYPLDDQHSPIQAVNAAKKFAADPSIVGVVGHLNSSCTKPASAIYNEAQLVQITPASTNPDISKQGFNTFFRICATDEVQGPKGAAYALKTLGLRKAYIIDDKTTYGVGLSAEFEKAFKGLGGEVLGHEGITQGDKDFTSIVTKVKALNPDLIFFGGIYPEGALLVKQARDLGITARFMGGDGLCDNIFISLATKDAAQGTVATMVGADMKKVAEGAELARRAGGASPEGTVGFVQSYEKHFGPVGLYSAYAYDAANIMIDAIRRSGGVDRKKILDEVRDTKDFKGAIGITNFDEKGDNLNKFIGIFEVKSDKFEYIGPAE